MAHIFIQANPLLLDDELKLKARYGLRYLFPDPPVTSLFEDGQTLALYRDRERTWAEIAKFSRADAEAYRRLSEQAAAWLPMIAATLYSAPMPLGASTAMLDQSREGRELWRTSQMSTHELLCRTFENDRVRLHFARLAGESLAAPDEKGTGAGRVRVSRIPRGVRLRSAGGGQRQPDARAHPLHRRSRWPGAGRH